MGQGEAATGKAVETKRVAAAKEAEAERLAAAEGAEAERLAAAKKAEAEVERLAAVKKAEEAEAEQAAAKNVNRDSKRKRKAVDDGILPPLKKTKTERSSASERHAEDDGIQSAWRALSPHKRACIVTDEIFRGTGLAMSDASKEWEGMVAQLRRVH
jgi:hypothetical protein